MPNETDPVCDDEFVFRRVLKKYYDNCPSSPDARVDKLAFRPTDQDVDGLSVYRALFVSPDELDRDREGKPGRYYVARLAVRMIKEIGLSVRANPANGLAGHSLIPEIRNGLKGDDKKCSKELQFALARIASADIVYSPPD